MSLGASHHGSGHETLQDDTSFIVEEMDLIYDHDIDDFHHSISLSGDHIPLFGSRNYNVGLLNLLLGHVHVTGQLTDLDFEVSQSCLKFAYDFRS